MTAQTHSFQAEVAEVLALVVNSLYSHKDVFLRELISNASDALDKLRFEALERPELLPEGYQPRIRLEPVSAERQLVISDNGIGMTEAELIEHLGTIAKSGTRDFAKRLAEAQQAKEQAPHLIGQFGVGFYSAFLVADRVEVVSRAAGEIQAYRWTSTGKDTFDLEPAERSEAGTTIILHLSESSSEFAEGYRLKQLVEKYSDYVAFPIELAEAPATEGGATEYRSINRATALWQRSPKEVTSEQYDEFYKHMSHDWEPSLARRHFRVEGTQEFVGLLFLPSQPPFDLFDPSSKHGVRLHVRRVLVMEACEELLPKWLRFVRGVVDSEDLPLNVSRETLQDSRLVRIIRKQVVQHALSMLDELAETRAEDYQKFWNHFGAVLKEGLHFEPEERERLAKLLRFASSHGEQLTSLHEYVSRMPESQTEIYYAVGPTTAVLQGSPQLESLRQAKTEILYLTDPVDPFAISNLSEFEGKKLIDAMSSGATLPGDSDAKETVSADEPLYARVASILGERAAKVRASTRLAESPACLVNEQGGLPPHLERLLRARQMEVPEQKRVFELNREHPTIQAMFRLHAVAPESPKLSTYVELLYDQALIAEGSPVTDAAAFSRRLTELLTESTEHQLSRA